MRKPSPALLLALALALSGPARAGEMRPAAPDAATETGADVADAIQRGVHHDACFGDRYETDADLNEGNRVTVEEILAVINPPRS